MNLPVLILASLIAAAIFMLGRAYEYLFSFDGWDHPLTKQEAVKIIMEERWD
jgi:hypothetical protein